MKKALLTSLMLLAVAMAAGQGYVRIDTVMKPYYQFDYEAWLADVHHPLLEVNSPLLLNPSAVPPNEGRYPLRGDAVQYNYIPGGTDIYGIAIRIYSPYIPFVEPWCWDEYLYIYDAEPNSFDLKMQYSINNMDSTAHYRQCGYIHRGSAYSSCESVPPRIDTMPPPMYNNEWRYYFDKPVHVTDSFYVGVSQNNHLYAADPIPGEEPRICLPPSYWFYNTNVNAFHGTEYPYNYDDSVCGMPWTKMKMRVRRPQDAALARTYLGVGLNEWGYTDYPAFLLVLPIIKVYDTVWTVDTPACRPVTSFGLMSRYGNTVRLRWTHDGTHSEWQVSYGPLGTLPDDGTMETCHTHTWSYEDTTGRVMVAYVRTVCRELDTVRYSEWSEGVEWYVQQGVEEAAGSEGVTLQPNPAREWVEVRSDERVLGIDVYDATGAKVRSLPEGISGFSVGSWVRGTYVLVVRMRSGNVPKRLVVE